ncbi:MAG: hypothetical protein ACJA2S_001582 [Cyclobacteriaceae bacterium]|jgi:hypothetical protein
MKNLDNSVEDFLINESFQAWVDGTNGDHEYLDKWVKENPSKKQVVEQAVGLHKALKMKGEKVTSKKIESSLTQVKK